VCDGEVRLLGEIVFTAELLSKLPLHPQFFTKTYPGNLLPIIKEKK